MYVVKRGLQKEPVLVFNTNNQVYQYKFLWVKYEKTGLKYKPHFFFLRGLVFTFHWNGNNILITLLFFCYFVFKDC